MRSSSPPTITSTGGPDNHARVSVRLPRREDLEAARTRMLKQGGPTKADLFVVDLGHGPMVIKDFGRKAWWVRPLGRLQIHRECRVYRRLGAFPGLPRFLGRIDPHALALEQVDGRPLAFVHKYLEPARKAAALERLRAVVGALHDAGVVHLDLRGRENILLGERDEICVLDMASALCFRTDRPPGRWLFRWLRLTDESALLKWKGVLDRDSLTERERAFLRRHRFWRSLWIFNRRGLDRRAGR